ncbi:MAG: hypothetical protein DHS20C16_02750 [Phycisphaerae bacterium]|nr:MAG: hypothetical protein DHS20C16_02750 [Phycisphaerae bacterium]
MKRCKAPRKISCAILGLVVVINGAAFADEDSQTVEVRVQAVEARAVGRFDILQIKAAQERLVSLGFDVSRCGHNPAEGVFRIEIDSADDERLLNNNGFDVSEFDDAGARGALVESSYFDPGEILTMLNQTASDHPGITHVFTIGTTIEGRPIRAIEISNNPGLPEDEPAIQFNAQHHAREVATSHIAMDLINRLTDQYGVNSEITNWVDNYKTVCVPMVNPDGVQYVFTSDDFWRKNRRSNTGCGTGSGMGVDLNRNYPYLWGPGCGSSNSCFSSIYRGPSSNSELETLAMMNLQDQYRFTIATSYHSHGRFIDYPYACSSGAPSGQMPEHGIIHEMMVAMAGAISAVDGVTYDPYTPVPFGGVNGDDTSWYYAFEGVYPFIVEVGNSFAPSFSQVPGIINRNRAGWEYLYDRLGQARMDLRVADHLAGLPLEAKVEMLQQDDTDILFDTGELDRFSEPTFGRSRWVTEASHTYTMRISKSGYQTRTIEVPVVNSPVDVPVLLLPDGVTLGDEKQDGDVDLADYAKFQECFDETPIQTECRIFDMDGDEAVNLSDIDDWTAALSGP